MDHKFAAEQINESCSRLGLAAGFLSIQDFLSTQPPYEVLRMMYEPGYSVPDVLQDVRDYVRNAFPSKRKLLEFVYGADSRLTNYTEWQNLRIPSPGKKALVKQICSEVQWESMGCGLRIKLQYKWLTSKVIHAFAFRPTFAEQHPFKKWPKAVGLYERRDIPKGKNGKRTLLIPIPPLRRIQRALLRLPLAIAQSSLPREVVGGRSKDAAANLRVGILENAARHVGQRFVATFDLANFFPSVHVSDVISTLQSLKCPMVVRSSPEPFESDWTHDGAVLVARLVTHRGRLPQGAPTSPAIANLVFARFDEQITWRLGRDFVYTRYFDDLTISVSAAAARKNGFETPQQMRDHVQKELETALQGSRFRLNRRKTRATSIDTGHKITGLFVSADQVTLPRTTRRGLSALMHQIKRDGLTTAAMKHVDGAILARTTFDKRRKAHFEAEKRLSFERQAASMVREICPELRVEVPGETWELGGRRVVRKTEVHEGKAAIRDVERLLARIWQEELLVTDEDSHFVVKAPGDTIVARLRCERNGDFFLLSRRQGVATVKLWHRLRGWWVGLNPGHRDECFASLEKFRKRIKETLDHALVRAQPRSAVLTPDAPSEFPAFSLLKDTGVIKELSGDVWKLYVEFVRQSNAGDVLAKATPLVPTLMAPATDEGLLTTWLNCARELMTDLLPKLPIRDENTTTESNGILGLIRVFCDRLEQRRNPQYDAEYRFLKKYVRKSNVHQLDSDDVTGVQRAVLEELKGLLTRCLNEHQQLGRDDWARSLTPNPWRLPLDKQIQNAYQRFVSLHAKAVWNTTKESVFREASHSEIANNANDLFETINEPTATAVSDKLFHFAKSVTCCTTDCLSGGVDTFSEEAREMIKKQRPANPEPDEKKDLHEELFLELGKDSAEYFRVIFPMRNRDAHSDNPHQRDDWNRIQKFVAKLLGRKWSPSKQPKFPNQLFQPDDLQLTSLEGTEVKLLMLRGICDGLEKLHPHNDAK